MSCVNFLPFLPLAVIAWLSLGAGLWCFAYTRYLRDPHDGNEKAGSPPDSAGKTIAIDFDGTLCADEYPGIGEPNEAVIAAAKAEQKYGARLILWTCRTGGRLLEAVEWCRAQGLEFDAVNGNLPEHMAKFGGDTRKVYADEYWDDRALVPPPVSGAKGET